MSVWIKVVALFLLVFALYDVCTPEPCEIRILSATQSGARFQQQHSSGDAESCQFEEDCFNCAHYAPGSSVALESVAVVAFTEPALSDPSLDGAPLLPYHPPRA